MSLPSPLPAAIRRYEGFLRFNPQNGALRARLGALYSEAGRHHEALECLKLCINVAPADAGVWRALARAHARAGQWRAAYDAYASALVCGPDEFASYAGLAQAAQALGWGAAARQACEHWIALARTPASRSFRAWLHWEQDEPGQALRLARAVLRGAPGQPCAHLVCWLALSAAGEAAGVHAAALIGGVPDATRAWAAGALQHLQHGHGPAAVAALTRALRLAPANLELQLLLGWARQAGAAASAAPTGVSGNFAQGAEHAA